MKSLKIGAAVIFVSAIVTGLASQALGYPPMLVKAKKFGARDCTFCHVAPDGGPPWNERGLWLIAERRRRAADTVDVEWLAEFKSGKSEDKKPSEQQPKPQEESGGAATIEQELMRLHRDLTDANLKRDPSVAAHLLADDAIITGPTGQIVTKAQDLEGIKQVSFESYLPDDFKIRVYGEAAVMVYHFAVKGTYQGQDVSGSYRETLVWAKRDARWQIVAAQVTRVLN
ncbi:MAG: nuclear transport factor 2 family protein [Blastocatellia bacterium]